MGSIFAIILIGEGRWGEVEEGTGGIGTETEDQNFSPSPLPPLPRLFEYAEMFKIISFFYSTIQSDSSY